MTALSPELTARIAKMLPMLSSSTPGDVVACAAAVDRTLKAAGRDWHDLAGHVAEGPKEVIVYHERPAQPGPQPFDYGNWRRTWAGCDPRRQHKARVDILQADRSGFLTDWEFTFVRSLGRQLAEGRPLSTKQVTLLNDLHARYVERYG